MTFPTTATADRGSPLSEVGSVQRYAEMIRPNLTEASHIDGLVISIISVLVDEETLTAHLSADDRLQRIRNVLAAGELVRAELREVQR